MGQAGTLLVGSYDYRLVVLSIFIAISASYAALDLGGRVTATRGRIRSAWLVGGAAAMGLGIWSMHFTGMLAYELPVPVAYHWPTVLLSLVSAILGSAIVLFAATRKKMGPVEALTGSFTMGIAIAGMHFIGMAAMRLPARCHYSLPLVGLAVVVGVLASLLALLLTFDFREETRGTIWARIISGSGMGIAISAMHYTGMASASFLASAVPTDFSHTVSISSLGVSGIILGTLTVLAATTATSSLDRRFAAQSLELQNSERFRQIADNLHAALALANANFSELLYVNRTYEVIWGRTLESLYAEPKSWLKGIHPEDRGQVEDNLQKLIGGQPVDNLEFRVVRPDGSTSWLSGRGFPIRDKQGTPYRLVCSAQDITERKRTEEQLQRGEAYLAMAQRMAQMGVWSWNPSTGVMFGSQEFYRILSVDPEKTKLTRELFLQSIHPEDRLMYESEINAAVQEKRNWELDYRIVLPDGSLKYIQGIGRPVFAPSGEILEFVGTTVDISDRKRSEREQHQIAAQLKVERARLVEAQEVAKMGSWETELQTLNVTWSEQTHRIFETDPSRFHPTRPSFREFIHPEDRAKVDSAFEASLGKHTTCTVEYRIVMSDGRIKILEERWKAFRDEQGKPVRVAGTCRDITERMLAEDELRRLSGRLLRLQDEERRKIARDLHDSTGQDLVALATTFGQLHAALPSSGRKLRKLASQGKRLAERCIREVRTLSYVLHPPMLDEAGLVEALRHFTAGFAERTGIQVDLEVSPNFGRLAPETELGLFRVVQESLTNIQRHSGSFTARIRLDRDPDRVILEVSDAGRGISANNGVQDKSTLIKVGVGIPSMQERVTQIGGRLDIDSGSHGTTVRIAIPVERK